MATISLVTGDLRATIVVGVMVILGVTLCFVQEAPADAAAHALQAMIRVTATVVRDGTPHEVPLRDLVPGRHCRLTAGDMISADLRLLSAKDLFCVRASLTGESMPVEKFSAAEPRVGPGSPLERGAKSFDKRSE